MELERPDWLTEEYLKNILKDSQESEDIIISSVDVTAAIPKGNNYTSDLLRVKVGFSRGNSSEVKQEYTSLIIKSPIESTIIDVLQELGTLKKEFTSYYEFLPKLSKIFGENEDNLTPKGFETPKGLIIVMEDLNFLGYKMMNRLEQLDFEHCAVVLKNLAKFHAASVKLSDDQPDLICKFGEDLVFNKNKTASNDVSKFKEKIWGTSQLKYLAKEIEIWPELKQYAEKLIRLADNLWEIQHELFQRKEDDFCVFNHGDLWSSNILFKHTKEGKPESVKFVDLQFMNYGVPAIDLWYFIGTSVRFEVVENSLDELLNIYLQSLNESLQKYGSQRRLSEEMFKKSMQEKEVYGFLTSCRILLFVLADEDTIIEFKNDSGVDIDDDNILKSYHKSKKFRLVFPKFLDYFSKKSWFKKL